MKKDIVVKIGGSLLYDKELKINTVFLMKIVNWFEKEKNNYERIILLVGGGTISRHLVNQLDSFSIENESKHNVGMQVTVVNALMLASLLHDPEIYIPKTLGDALEAIVGDEKKLIVSGGLKSGWSTDMDAAVLADIIGADRVYKLSNIDYVYTEDPRNNPNARSIKDMSWREYFKQFQIVPGETIQKPNAHSPVGIAASQFSARKGISFFVSGGKTLEGDIQIKDVFETGTFIHP